MRNRFLLYIDLLGFTNLVQKGKGILPGLFHALDRSNIHTHPGSFGVIQFSDTIIVYNEIEANLHDDKKQCVMFLCEFAQEIQLRLLGCNTFIRAVITYGQFEDTGSIPNSEYRNIRAFWGESIISAFRTEKAIQAVGLFVNEDIEPFLMRDLFEPHLFDTHNQIWFVDTAKMLRHQFFEGSDFSYAKLNVESSGTEHLLAYDLFYLRCLYAHSHDLDLPPQVRTKYLNTWEIYRQKHTGLCCALEDSGFDFDSVLDMNLKPYLDVIGTSEGYFG